MWCTCATFDSVAVLWYDVCTSMWGLVGDGCIISSLLLGDVLLSILKVVFRNDVGGRWSPMDDTLRVVALLNEVGLTGITYYPTADAAVFFFFWARCCLLHTRLQSCNDQVGCALRVVIVDRCSCCSSVIASQLSVWRCSLRLVCSRNTSAVRVTQRYAVSSLFFIMCESSCSTCVTAFKASVYLIMNMNTLSSAAETRD